MMRSAFMVRLLVIASFLAALAPGASAWSNRTYVYVCDSAVTYAWGSDVLDRCVYNQTMDFQKNFCSLLRAHEGETAYESCLSESGVVHPAVMSMAFFSDKERHRDYSTCPIRSDLDAKSLCGSVKNSPAWDNYLYWLNKAKDSPDVCMRVYAFCVASSYFADTYNPLNHIVSGVDTSACSDNLDRKVEARLFEQSASGWEISQVCGFKYMQERIGQVIPARYTQEFIVSNKTIADLVMNLTSQSQDMAELPYLTTTSSTTTTVPATTIPLETESSVVTTVETSTTIALPADSSGDEEAREGDSSWTTVLLAFLVLIVIIAFLLISQDSDGGKFMEKFGRFVGGEAKHRHKRSHAGLRGERESEGLMHEDRGRSRLGAAGHKGQEGR
ncbi:MAG: hypothetical protein PHG85_03615 [Candidatus Altiarchaeota archaeon]|nr:hypothetical protein [Candidatus Altiarchaeota archaeon]